MDELGKASDSEFTGPRPVRFYLQLINRLYGRYAAEDRNLTISAWAYTVAAAILVKLLFQLLSAQADILSFIRAATANFLYLYVATIFLWIVLQPSSGGVRKNKYDYTTDTRSLQTVFARLVSAVILLLGIPWLCVIFGAVPFGRDVLQDIFLYTCEYVFPIIFVVMLADSSFRILTLNEGALPIFRDLTADSHGMRYVRRVIGLLGVFIGALAVYSLVKTLEIENLHSYASNWLYAGYLTALLILTLLILRASTAKYYLKMLSRLERDIVLYRVSEQEILKRLTMEVFSPHIGAQVERRLNRIHAVGEGINNSLVNLEALMKELTKQDDAEKRKVIEQGLNKAFDEVERAQEEYRAQSRRLVKWLKRAIGVQQVWNEPVLTELINGYMKAYIHQFDEFNDKFIARMKTLKQLAETADMRRV